MTSQDDPRRRSEDGAGHTGGADEGADAGPMGDELADALESLRVARRDHQRLAREVAHVRRENELPSRVDAKGIRNGGGEVARLRSHIADLADLLSRGETAARTTNTRVRQHVSSVKSEVDAVKREVATLHDVVAVAEERCATAAEEVRQLRLRLRGVTTDRDEISARLAKLIADARNGMKVLDADMERKQSELERLSEQNAYLSLQLVQRH
jgi:chromosome segregation ATPase